MANLRLKTVIKHNPTLDSEIASLYLDWCNTNNYNALTHLEAMRKWFSYSSIRIENLNLEELKEYTIRKEIRQKNMKDSGKRPDIVDISLAKVYYKDDESSELIYKMYCKNKSKKMVITIKENPQLADSKSYSAIARKHGEEKAEEIRKKRLYDCGKPVRLEYFLEQGMSLEEAKEALDKRQSTFSRDKCIEKYGEELGLEIFEQRQNKWQQTLTSKPEEEIREINSRKAITLDRMITKHGEELGREKYESWLSIVRQNRNHLKNFSKESIAFLKSFVPEEILLKSFYGENEISISDENFKTYYYDFNYKNIIIEYHGEAFHPNPNVVSESWVSAYGVSYQDAIKKDLDKRQLAISKGYNFFEIYSNNTEEEKQKFKTQVLEELLKAKNLA